MMAEIKINCIIAIDPGANGGIAVYRPNAPLTSVKMPKSAEDIKNYLEYWKEIARPIVFIEKLSVRPDDIAVEQGGANMGKLFRIQKMIANFEQLKTTIELSGVPYVQVHPMKWQNALKLRIKGEEKKERKNRYKKVAGDLYPEMKITLWNADALLIMHFGRYALQSMTDWVLEQLPKREHPKLF